jgi:hypothetical protein
MVHLYLLWRVTWIRKKTSLYINNEIIRRVNYLVLVCNSLHYRVWVEQLEWLNQCLVIILWSYLLRVLRQATQNPICCIVVLLSKDWTMSLHLVLSLSNYPQCILDVVTFQTSTSTTNAGRIVGVRLFSNILSVLISSTTRSTVSNNLIYTITI